MTWQPIETAPRDTRLILTFNFKDVYTGACDNNDALWYDGGWEVPTPTHWMPLPAPPMSPEDEFKEALILKLASELAMKLP